MCNFIRSFEKKNNEQVLPMLIGDWNEECIGTSMSKKLCDEFSLVNIFQAKFPNNEKFKTYKEGSTFLNYGLIHKELIDEVDQVTFEPFGYRKGKGDHRGWYFVIQKLLCLGFKSIEYTSQKEEVFRVKIVNNNRIT